MKHSSDFVTIVNESRPTADTPADSQDQNLVDSLVRRIKSFQSYQITEVMSTSTTDVVSSTDDLTMKVGKKTNNEEKMIIFLEKNLQRNRSRCL